MRKWMGVLVLTMGLGVGVVGAQQRPQIPPERKEWQDRYGRLANAFLKKDASAMKELAAPDSVWQLLNGKKGKLADCIADFNRRFDIIQPNVQYTLNVTKLDVKGSQAVVERTSVLAGFVKDAAGRRHNTFDGSGWEDVWAKTAKGWVLRGARQINQRTSLDGRPGDPYAPGAADAAAARRKKK